MNAFLPRLIYSKIYNASFLILVNFGEESNLYNVC